MLVGYLYWADHSAIIESTCYKMTGVDTVLYLDTSGVVQIHSRTMIGAVLSSGRIREDTSVLVPECDWLLHCSQDVVQLEVDGVDASPQSVGTLVFILCLSLS